MSAHSPTPWQNIWGQYIIPANHADRRIGGSTNAKEDRDEFAHVICKIERNSNRFADDQASANSAFIVKAVNSHADMAEAIKRLLTCMSLAGWEDDDTAVFARKVLAAAGEQP